MIRGLMLKLFEYTVLYIQSMTTQCCREVLSPRLIKHIDLPKKMQRAMDRQAEAERERRAKVINAEGEFQAAAKLA
jgi:hypothetical protein